eukprot:CAMPEP_0118694638 /NCGR_PEP_ID=MMETSP0800-20121206/12661_1 /TAXON_ID=210618 ORGANISM="Striatella unipunctata, Strain CCMP2910" /NCGR_SAMPLE_ID=MMETSP0800 /ASSEMBLY_ACC=CAM_ASM_000638 /LENGTH=166 /DNA_ID=CAMNT_0006593179 /DNA_START=27 /DNA_END=527 /DNA_ORIENTATION=-
MVAALIGSTPIICTVECAAGIKEGGKTGLTAVVIGLYFLLSIVFAPLFASVPDQATAPVLILVGTMMMGESGKIRWEKMDDALPAFLTIVMMPLTYSITNGMVFGLAASVGFYVTSGQAFVDATPKLRGWWRQWRNPTSSLEQTPLVVPYEDINSVDDDSLGAAEI